MTEHTAGELAVSEDPKGSLAWNPGPILEPVVDVSIIAAGIPTYIKNK